MDWIKLIAKYPLLALSAPACLSLVQFIAHVIVALDDGRIDSAEFHSLMSSASGFEVIILGVLMIVVKKTRKK